SHVTAILVVLEPSASPKSSNRLMALLPDSPHHLHIGLPPMGNRSVLTHRICWLARRNRIWCHPAGTNSTPKPSSVILTGKHCTPAETATSKTPGSKTGTPVRHARSTTEPMAPNSPAASTQP